MKMINSERNDLTIVYAARYRGLNTSQVHTHSIFQLYILDSEHLELYNGSSSYIPDHTKEILLIKPNVEHCLRLVYDSDTQDWFDKNINCAFDCKFSVNDNELYQRLSSLPEVLDVGDTAFCKKLAVIILNALSDGNTDLAHSAFRTLIYSLMLPQSENPNEPVFYTNNYDWQDKSMGLNDIKNYIDKNYHTKIELDDLVRMSRMNRSTLCREFRRAYATSPIHYILQKRIEESKTYLAESAIKITELSERLGFSSASYFNRIFKGFTGESPGEYRKKHQSLSVKL
ncbi:MAG: helix-turn-helix transcriptional regulator [Clostridia bacterium]|nr:helix-turn-helix transcriptional regulator [Clostridia bacterium]